MLAFALQAWRERSTHYHVWALAIPMILSNLTVPLVGLVDSAVIGHLPHAHQLGAVAVGNALYMMLASLAGTTLRMGITGFSAQATGQHDYETLKRIALQSITFAWAFALTLGLIAFPITDVALRIMGASPELEGLAREFFHIRIFGLPAILTQQALVGWMLGRQNARAPLAMMLVTNITNIILVIWLVLGLGWEVKGAATASITAEWLGLIFSFWLLIKHTKQIPARIHWHRFKQLRTWRPLFQANLDIFIRTLALQVIFVSVTLRGAQLGDATVAANALLLNGLLICSFAMDGIAHAVEALCGRAIGAGDRRTLFSVLVVATLWALVISAAFALVFGIWGDGFIALQTSMQDVREVAHHYLPYLAALPLIAVWSFILDGLFIAGTKSKAMRNVMVFSVVGTLPVAMLFLPAQNHGVWIALLFFLSLRGATMAWMAYRIDKNPGWLHAQITTPQGLVRD